MLPKPFQKSRQFRLFLILTAKQIIGRTSPGDLFRVVQYFLEANVRSISITADPVAYVIWRRRGIVRPQSRASGSAATALRKAEIAFAIDASRIPIV